MPTKLQKKSAASGFKASKTVRSSSHCSDRQGKMPKSVKPLPAQQFRDLFDSTSDLIQSVAPDGHFLYVNKAWRDVLGYSQQEIDHLTIWDIISPESMDHCMGIFRKVMTGEHVHDIEAVFVTKNGRQVVVEGDAHCRFVDGKPFSTQGFFRDITRRKLAEEALRQSEERYRTVLEEMEEGYFETDIRGNFTVINDATCYVLGYPREEIVGINYRAFLPEKKHVDAVYQAFNQVYRTGKPIRQLAWEALGKDGGRKFIEASVAPLRGQEGQIIGFRGIGRDVTAGRKSEERYQTIIRTAMNGFWLTDMQGRFLDVNEAYCNLIGYSREELLNMSISDVEVIEKSGDTVEHIRKVKKVGYDRFETRHRRKDGGIVDVEISVNHLSTDGGRQFVFIQDITERKRAEEMLANEAIWRRILVDQSSDGIVVLDGNGKVYEVNLRFADMLGYSLEEARELNVWDWEYQFPPEQVQEMIRTVDENGNHFETKHRRKDGTTYDVEISTNAAMFAGHKLIFCVCRDITKRKQAEEALVKSEERYRSVLEQMEEAYYEVDVAGNFTFVNDATCRQLGHSREELIGMNYRVYTSKDDLQKVYKTFNRVYRTGKPYKGLPVLRIRKDGSRLSAEISAFPLRNEDGEVIGFRGIASDVTERKWAEAELRQRATDLQTSQLRLIEAQALAHLGDWELDPVQDVVSGSEEFYRLFDVTPEKLANYQDFISLLHPDDRERVRQDVEEALSHNGPYHTEYRVVLNSGEYRYIQAIGQASMEEKGRPVRLFGTCLDITERKRAEEKLRASEEQLRTSLENAPDGVYLSDLEGNLIYGNRKCEEIIGYKREELIGKNFLEMNLLSENSLAKAAELLQANIEGLSTGPDELELIRKDGQRVPVEINTSLAQHYGQMAVLAFVRDATERKQAEEKVKKLYSLQTAIRYINESLLKVNDERALFEQVCRFLSDIEFIRFCWIGLVDKENLEVKRVAYSGFEDGRLSSLKINLGSSAYNRGPIGIAVKTRQPCTVADIKNDARFTPGKEEALKRGYASSLAIPLIQDTEVIGVLSIYSGIKDAFGDEEVDFLVEAANDIALGIRTLRLRRELQQSLDSLGKALEGTVSALASVAEIRDPYTAGHQQRVTRLAVAIASDMGLPQEQIEGIHVAGTLHDVGKLYIPAEILSKPGRLNEAEFNLVKMHPQAGYDVLKSVEFPWPIAQIVLQHHERLDGSGYPRGLKGEDILLEAKILAVADVVEAMASHRPYRPSLGMGQALDEISKNSSILYDPKVVDACFKLFYEKEFKLD